MMRAVVFHAPRTLRVEEVPRPPSPRDASALVRVVATAICGSDLHLYEGRVSVDCGFVLGHEYVGVVEEIGPGVTGVRPGDRVTGAPVVPCGVCRACHRGRFVACPFSRILGSGVKRGNLAGAQAELLTVPQADLVLRRVPDGVRDEQALLIGDVAATGFDAVRKAGPVPGGIVAVAGAGPVGLAAAQAALLLGASQVVVIDPVADRRALAAKFGARAVDPQTEDPTEVLAGLGDGLGADLAVDAVGAPSVLAGMARLVRKGGSVSVPGVYNEDDLRLPFGDFWGKGIRILTGLADYQSCLDDLLRLTEAGALDPAATVSHRMPLSAAEDAYALFGDRAAIKIVLDPAK